MPKVSIIIPAHNEERHIERCIQSLLTQDYKDIEIIVVDNGSRDKTPEIVQRHAEKHDGKVKLLRLEKNMGPGCGRNLGAAKASGDILIMIDADMFFPPDYIGKLIGPIERGEAILATHSTEYVANTGNPWVKVQGQTTRGGRGRAGEVFRAVSKEFFIRHGGFDPRLHYHDDRTFFYKTGVKAIVVKDAYCYHNNPDTAKEIFRRNYWIGRTFIAVVYNEQGLRGLLHVTAITLMRLMDIIALPSTVAWAVLQPTTPILNALILAPLLVFTASTLRMKIIKAKTLKEELMMRILYAPSYRIVRAAGLLAGVLASLFLGLHVASKNLDGDKTAKV